MTSKSHRPRFALCVENGGDDVSLELCKVYRLLADARAEKAGLIRVIDESGEDYLYPREDFVAVELPEEATRALLRSGASQRRRCSRPIRSSARVASSGNSTATKSSRG